MNMGEATVIGTAIASSAGTISMADAAERSTKSRRKPRVTKVEALASAYQRGFDAGASSVKWGTVIGYGAAAFSGALAVGLYWSLFKALTH